MRTPRSNRRLRRLPTAPPARRRRLRDERGASLVEFAFVLPILVILVFGIVEFGFTFNRYLELRSGSREGARMAAVNNGCNTTASGCATTPDDQRADLIAATRSRLNGLAAAADIGVKFDFPDGTLATDNDTGDEVRVCVYYPNKTVTGFFPFLQNINLKSVAVMRLEQDATFSAGESLPATPPSGGSPCP